MKIDTHNIIENMKGTFIDHLGMKFVETDDQNTLEATMAITQKHTQLMGLAHGGATVALAETVAGIGSNVLCNANECSVGMQISASHVRSGQKGDTMKACATIQFRGRTTHVWNVDIFSEQTGKLLSTVRVTNAIIKKQ